MALEGYTLAGASPQQSALAGYVLPNPMAGYTLGGQQPAQDHGILSSIVHEFGRDIKGGFNVANATLGEFLTMLGAAAPVTWEDVTTRDIRGALMLGALGAGGFVSSAARGLPLMAGLAQGGAVSRATGLAMAEAVAGAATGMIRPIDEDETRLGAVLGDAAFTGAFGAGLSFAKSGIKATIGGRLAAIKQQASLQQLGNALKHQEAEDLVRESAGVVLLNPQTGARQAIRRLEDGSIQRTLIDSSGAVTDAGGSDFGGTLAKAVEAGFTENLGVNRKQFARELSGKVDQATLDLLAQARNDVSVALGPVRLQEYAAVRSVMRLRGEAQDELDSLAGEVLAQSTELGVPRLAANARANLIKELGPQAAALTDGDLMREGFRKGLISADTAKAGISLDQYTRDLFLSDLAPDVDIVINPHLDAVGVSLLNPRRLAKWHPEFAPIYQRADVASAMEEEGRTVWEAWLSSLRQSMPVSVMNAGAKLIDDTAIPGDIPGSRAAALAAAQASGNPQLAEFVTQVTGKLDEMLQKAQAAGIVDEGISGYFPLVVANKWKLDLQGISKEELAKTGTRLFYPKKAEAEAAVEALRQQGYNVSSSISLQTMWHPMEVAGMDPQAVDRMRKGFKAAFSQPPLKSTPFAKQRTLGIRDFSEDAYQALAVYGASMERALAWRTFARDVEPFMAAISPSQPRLRAAAEQYIDDMLGRPRASEQVFQAALEAVGYDAPPRALKKYTAALRKWETSFRLGGPFSAIVNVTQVLTNTNAVLGPRWTASGMEVFMSPGKYKAAMETLHSAGYKLSHVMPFADTNELAVAFGGPKAALREGRYGEALHRMAMFLFNGAEKNNRLVTAWGAYKKALSEGLDAKQAAGYAEEVVNRTQFIPRLSNTPELLRSPVGGLLLQFKSFVINEIDFIASLNKQEALRFGASIYALGGLALFMNMPGTDIVDQASTMFFGKKVSEMAALKSKDAGVIDKSFLYGLPGLMNVDMSDYIGVGTVADVTRSILGPAPKDAMHVATFLMDAAKDFKSSGSVHQRTFSNLVQAAGPSAVRRALRGHEIFATGEVRNAYTGKLIYKPERRLRAAVSQAIGFPELEMTQERAAEAVITRARDSYIRGRTQFAKEAAAAIRDGNSSEAQRVMNEAMNNGFDLDQRTVSYWVKEMGRTGAERRERRTPQALRAEYSELFEATGTLELQ